MQCSSRHYIENEKTKTTPEYQWESLKPFTRNSVALIKYLKIYCWQESLRKKCESLHLTSYIIVQYILLYFTVLVVQKARKPCISYNLSGVTIRELVLEDGGEGYYTMLILLNMVQLFSLENEDCWHWRSLVVSLTLSLLLLESWVKTKRRKKINLHPNVLI